MPPAFVQGKGFVAVGSTTGTATFTSNVTGGNTIVVFAGSQPGATDVITNVTDNHGNSYSRKVTGLNCTGASHLTDADVWIASNVTGGSLTVTVTYNSSVNPIGIVAEVSGLATSSVFDQTSNNTALTLGTTYTSNSTPTTTSANEYLMGLIYFSTSSPAITPSGGFTQQFNYKETVNFNVEFFVQDLNVTSTGTYAAAGANTGNADYLAVIITLVAAGGPVTVDKSYNNDLYVAPMPDHSYNNDLFCLAPVDKHYNNDLYVFIAGSTNVSYNNDLFVSIISVLQFINVLGNIQFPINPNAFIKVAGTVLQPLRQFIQVLGTIKNKPAPSFVNVAGRIQTAQRNYVKVAGTISNDKLKSWNNDVCVSTGAVNLVAITVLGTLIAKPIVGPCGGFPDAVYINVAGWIIEPGGVDSIQVPNQGFTRADDWYSSQDALGAYRPTSVFTILGSTLPVAGISLIVTAFTSGVASFQTRTRSWLRRVDAAPSGILLTTKVNTHTLPNGAVITTTTNTTQNQDTLTTQVTIVNSATPTRKSVIVTEKNSSGQTITRETDTNTTNGIINSLTKKSVFTEPPTSDNIQPLQVRTLDGIVHYQFFNQQNKEWAGGDQEGLTTTQKAVQLIPGQLNGQTTDAFGNLIYNQVTDIVETDPNGKVTETHTEEIGTRRDVGTTTTDTAESFNGIQTTTTKTTHYPDGSTSTSTVVTNAISGDQVETDVETVVDEYGQVTITTTKTETQTFPDPFTGAIRQVITKTVTVNKGGVTTVDTSVDTNNDFEDDIVNQKVKVYAIQEFTITCTIDEFSMEALSEINLTHQKNYALLELLGQQLGNANLSYGLRQTLIQQFNLANSCIAPVTLVAMGRRYRVVFAQSASAFRAKYIPGTLPHVWELQMILQARSDLVNGTFGG